MFGFFSKNRPSSKAPGKEGKKKENSGPRPVGEPGEGEGKKATPFALSSSLKNNVSLVEKVFFDVDILRVRYIENDHAPHLRFAIIYCDGVVDNAIINDSIMRPLMLCDILKGGSGLLDTVMNKVVEVNEVQKSHDLKEITEAISYGDTALFAEGEESVLILNTKSFMLRGVTEPEGEKILSGPREGFTESLMANLSMIRRKVSGGNLKMKFMNLGRQTNTKLCVCYMEDIVNREVLRGLYRRLSEIDIDAVLDSNYITELIRDSPRSFFRTTGYTERPDVVIGKLLEGRVALFVDGTPVVMTVPYLFIENFQSSEDYYLSFFYTSVARMIRVAGFIITISIPGLFIALVAFQHEMLPTQLLINIASERQSVPLPAALEAFVMLLVFDILKETGVRMPNNIGQALSIVGALVIGQAAVEAKLVAAPMIIVVGLTGITNLLVPKMNASVFYVRLLLLIASSMFGLFGLLLGLSALLIHLLNLRSFGIPQISLSGGFKPQNMKDTVIRGSWRLMIKRPQLLTQNRTRQRKVGDDKNG